MASHVAKSTAYRLPVWVDAGFFHNVNVAVASTVCANYGV